MHKTNYKCNSEKWVTEWYKGSKLSNKNDFENDMKYEEIKNEDTNSCSF